jgi:ABC-type oligopeptide transport system substrate-binding subunit
MNSNRVSALAAVAVLASFLAACGQGHQTAAATQGAAAAPATAAASPADPHNPLIGSWRFTGIGAGPPTETSGCSITMTFAANQWTQTQGGATTNMSVSYIPSAKVVYVVSPDGGHVTYVLVDANHIALDSFAPCTYERAG